METGKGSAIMSLLDHDFFDEYELELSAWGDGVLADAELLNIQKLGTVFKEFRKEYKRLPDEIRLDIQDSRAFGLDYGFTGVDPAFLEKLTTLKELILPDSITSLDVTPAVEEILKKNDTLIRGTFDSFAEAFARERGLRFRPSDLRFAFDRFEPMQETTTMTLQFLRSGKVRVEEKISSPGSSAGSTFGGEFYYELPSNFYETMTVEQIAEPFRGALYNDTIERGKLAAFLEKAKAHGYYTGKN